MATVEEWLERRRRIATDGQADVQTDDPLNPGTVSGQAIREELTETFGEGGGVSEVTSAQISDATDVGRDVLTAEDAATARSAIGAGTSDLTIGTTASTAKAGNYQPTVAQGQGLQAIIDDLTARIEALETPEAEAMPILPTEDVAPWVQATAAELDEDPLAMKLVSAVSLLVNQTVFGLSNNSAYWANPDAAHPAAKLIAEQLFARLYQNPQQLASYTIG